MTLCLPAEFAPRPPGSSRGPQVLESRLSFPGLGSLEVKDGASLDKV